MGHVEQPSARTSGRVRLGLLLALSAGLPAVLAVLVTAGLSFRNGDRLVRALVADLQLEVAAGAADALGDTLDPPHLLNDLNVDLLDQDLLSPTDFDQLQRHFMFQLQRFESTGYVQLGLADGHFVGVERTRDGYRVERTDRALAGKAVWELDPATGERLGGPVAEVPGYRATARPWFRAAVDAGGATWSPIYQFSSRDRARLGVTAVRPWSSPEGTLRGVIGTDIVLAQLGEQVDSPRLRAGGRVFVVERSGEIVAHSELDQPFTVGSDGQATRMTAQQTDDPLTVAAVSALEDRWGALSKVKGATTLDVRADGEVAFVYAEPFRDDRGVDWLLVVALPRADFTPELRRNTRTTLLLSAIAGVLTLFLALFVAGRIAAPIRALSDAVRAMGSGRWDEDLPHTRTAEVAELADAFRRMRTELHEKEEALAATVEQALEAKAEAEAANRAKSSFLANMSHELRTPLNAILGYAELLQETEGIPEEGHEDLGRIRSAGRHLLGLISDVLDLSRIEAGHLDLTVTRVDARDLATEAVDATRHQLEGGHNRIEIVAPQGAMGFDTDEQKARQALVNLLGNAAKFTTSGTVTLVVEPTPERILFHVRDTGIGIPAEKLGIVFAPFTQIDESRTGNRGGAGLGLAITREFARALGGDITVISTPGVGSIFTLDLPRSGPPRRTTTPGPERRDAEP